jgi:hypothetical protein
MWLFCRLSSLLSPLFRQKEKASVLIIGGGITGTELAAEISSDSQFRDLNIILVHSNRRLLPTLSPSASEYAHHFLIQHNVTLILGQKVVKQIRHNHQNVFVTNAGNYLYADIAFYCANPQPSSEFLRDSMKHCLDSKGWILVNKFLQLSGTLHSISYLTLNNRMDWNKKERQKKKKKNTESENGSERMRENIAYTQTHTKEEWILIFHSLII